MDGKSTRGIDFTVEGDRIELRMTNFSNEGDYFVIGVLAKLFKDVYKCKIVDERSNRVKVLSGLPCLNHIKFLQ